MGKIIFSAWGKIKYCQSAQIAEALACYEGLKIASAGTDSHITVETDCQSLLKVFDPGDNDRTDLGTIARDFNLLITEGKTVKLEYRNREANCLAHDIAAFAARESSFGVLFGRVPPCVLEQAERDCKNAVTS